MARGVVGGCIRKAPGARPALAYDGRCYTTIAKEGGHETCFWCDVQAGCACGLVGIRSGHHGLSVGAVSVNSLQRRSGYVVWLPAALSSCGRKKPRTDVVCAALVLAVHAPSGHRRAVRISDSSSSKSASTRSSWLIGGCVGFCDRSQPKGSTRGSTMRNLRCGGLWLAGLCQFWPYALKSIWKQINAGDLLFGISLDQDSQLGRGRAKSISDVLQVADSRFALRRELLALGWRQAKKKWFEVHSAITPQGVMLCQHLLVTFAV